MIQEFLGETKSKNVLDEISQIYKEEFLKSFPEYFEKNYAKAFSVVTSTKNGEIKQLGISKVEDLLTDNFGIFLGALFGGNISVSMTPTSGVTVPFDIWTNNSQNFSKFATGFPARPIGSLIKVGDGSTPATRADFNIENELQNLGVGVGGYDPNLAKITAPASSVSTFNGGISEACLFGQWAEQNVAQQSPVQVLLSRDNISPIVNVLIGETINVDYELIFS